jgi:restriction endonuclease
MLVVAYVIADRKGIMKEFKMLWEKIKERYEI